MCFGGNDAPAPAAPTPTPPPKLLDQTAPTAKDSVERNSNDLRIGTKKYASTSGLGSTQKASVVSSSNVKVS